MMNSGATLDEIIHTVRAPDTIAGKPWLQAVYDEPEFIVRNIWRLEGGWYDGVPSNLKPASDAERAREIAALAARDGAGRSRSLGKYPARRVPGPIVVTACCGGASAGAQTGGAAEEVVACADDGR